MGKPRSLTNMAQSVMLLSRVHIGITFWSTFSPVCYCNLSTTPVTEQVMQAHVLMPLVNTIIIHCGWSVVESCNLTLLFNLTINNTVSRTVSFSHCIGQNKNIVERFTTKHLLIKFSYNHSSSKLRVINYTHILRISADFI